MSIKAEPSCNLCAKSFREINATIELVFCPFCGAKQPSEERVASRELGNLNLESGLYKTTLQKTQVREYNLLDDAFLKDGALNRAPQTNVQDLALDGFTNVTSVGSPNGFPIADESRSLQPRKKSLLEDDFSGLDAGFDDDKLVDDLISYMSPAHGHNLLSQNNGFDTGDQFVSKQKRKEDWENFLDEDIEEQIEATDQFFEDGDLLESVKIVEYASRLTSQIIIYKSTDRKKTYDFFIDVLGDFPFYQSYAALERLIAKGLQLDHIQDVYSVKLLWLMNPSIWSNRYYNKMERMWITSTNTRLKNSMSWQLASDLALNHSATDLENIIINDWFALWLNLPIMDGSTASGINPAYRSYSAYLYQSSNHNL